MCVCECTWTFECEKGWSSSLYIHRGAIEQTKRFFGKIFLRERGGTEDIELDTNVYHSCFFLNEIGFFGNFLDFSWTDEGVKRIDTFRS